SYVYKIFTKKDCGFLFVFLILAVAFLTLSETRTYAQVVGATLSGTVTDATGAILPNVHVSIRNTATGITRGITADTAGFYTAPNLLPGNYEVTFSASGFATQVSSGATLTVGAQQGLNVSLRGGQFSQQGPVPGDAP